MLTGCLVGMDGECRVAVADPRRANRFLGVSGGGLETVMSGRKPPGAEMEWVMPDLDPLRSAVDAVEDISAPLTTGLFLASGG